MKRIYTLIIASLFLSSAAHAQTSQPVTWKKRVARTIDMSEKEDTARHKLRNMTSDSLLVQLFVNAVQAGKLPAYNTWDAMFSTKISQAELKERFACKTDTILIVDPVTGKEQTKLRKTDVNFDKLQKLRVLEDWVFYPETGSSQLQIIGLAPVQDVYGDDGSYRGQQAIFWLKYNDAQNTISRYEQFHPDNTVSSHIWSDYFMNDIKPTEFK